MSSPKNETTPNSTEVDRKRGLVRKLIECYYYQLTDGCGNPGCSNEHCPSSGKIQKLPPNQAAAQALELFKKKATLCKHSLNLSPPTSDSQSLVLKFRLQREGENMDHSGDAGYFCSPTSTSRLEEASSIEAGEDHQRLTYLTEQSLKEIIDKCTTEGSYSRLIRTIGYIFSREESLKMSFLKQKSDTMTKEDIRSMEVDEDKDEDSQDVSIDKEPDLPKESGSPFLYDEISIDIDAVRRSFRALFSIPGHPFQQALINALIILSKNLEIDLKYHKAEEPSPKFLNTFAIVMEIPMLECPEYLEAALPAFCRAAALLPCEAQNKLARFWSTAGPARLKEMVDTLHHLITLRVVSERFTREYCVNDEDTIVSATKLMKVLYYANIYGGEMDREEVIFEETEQNDAEDTLQDLLQGSKEPKQNKEDPLAQSLNVKVINCRKPIIPFEDFCNEPLSDHIEMDKDFACYKAYKAESGRFSFMNYSFILTPAVKALGLYYDNRIRMFSERRFSVLQSLIQGAPPNPYLKLKVRRDHLIDDALVGLEMVAMENPNNLKKQLVVEFEGEQGIDEGGVSKEFFQLVVEEIFNPDFAMFSLNPETRTYWFNPTSFESDAQFTLIGIILGLAIYNNVILDVHFPMVVYRKLMGKKGTFLDLADWNPALAKSLRDMLEFEGDLEDVFLQTFLISYHDIFGTVLTHELKEGGKDILVNQHNKHEYVELYSDFLLNKSIEKQFRAFRRGFVMVTDDSPLKMLFRPEEVELLVCGSKNFDFNALEESTEYDGGYTSDSPIIKWIPHFLNLDQKLNRIRVSKALLKRHEEEGDHFLDQIVTGDESWRYHYDPSTKQHPAYIPDLVPSDYFLFGLLKKELKEKRFDSDEDVQKVAQDFLHTLPKSAYKEGIYKLPERWRRCIESQGDYFE
ncbi:UBE3A [Cordylochernes scorpioides]|uniref:HECT-type E3 ubiquitin transferase n=1 Tax=Cordylochernes scorpioides TaxID=51811 RepID=A0ABY6JV71_9ARAC|nr:UBE3A [Cordylochernes scorpioides]